MTLTLYFSAARSAVVLFALAASAAFVPAQASAQIGSRAASPQPRYAPVPDDTTLSRLVWSTMIALDNANRTGIYDVLHSLGSPKFQRRNSPATLAALFSPLRDNRIDVGRTITLTPDYYTSPAILSDGTLRLRGGFDGRPKAIRFDLIYAQIGGGWQIEAISVVEMESSAPR